MGTYLTKKCGIKLAICSKIWFEVEAQIIINIKITQITLESSFANASYSPKFALYIIPKFKKVD